MSVSPGGRWKREPLRDLRDRIEEMRWPRRLQRGGKSIAPGDCAGIHAGGACGLDVADLVADTDGVCGLRSEQPCDAPELAVLAEYRRTAVEAGNQACRGAKHAADGFLAVGADDCRPDAEGLQVGEQRCDAIKQRYLTGRSELALSPVAPSSRQPPHPHAEPRPELPA